MTYVEFFDKETVENICTCFVTQPDRVIFIGSDKGTMESYIGRYERIFADRGIRIRFETAVVRRDDLSDSIAKITEIVERVGSEEPLVFDLTGGDDLCLVAMGAVYERYKDRGIQMHRVNLRNNKVSDCDADGNVISEKDAPAIGIVENVRAFGGDVVFADDGTQGTARWNLTADFMRDIESMWKIFRTIHNGVSVGSWNRQIKIFEAIESYGRTEGLTTAIALPELKRQLGKESEEYVHITSLTGLLKKYGLAEVREADGEISVTYKNPQVKRCLTKAGQALEMIVYLFVLQAKDKRGAPVYNDVMNGVYIDWDGRIHGGGYDTENEIDVMMMHGAVPVFVSCKNGKVEMEELYKLDAVASRFGGKYARRVLVATSLGHSDFAAYFRQRAEDMKIDLLEPMELSDDAFRKELGHAWSYITKR